MLFVLFQLGPDRYAMEASQILEVVPLVQIKPVPQAPAGVAGLFDYRGTPLPAVDLNALAMLGPAPRRISTRILLTQFSDGLGRVRRLGVIVEKATQTMHRQAGDFAEAGLHSAGAPYLGPVTHGPDGELTQWVQAQRLLSPAVLDALSPPPPEALCSSA